MTRRKTNWERGEKSREEERERGRDKDTHTHTKKVRETEI